MSALADAVHTPAGRWLEPLRHWPGTALRLLREEKSVIRVLVAGLRGSGPREAGACLLLAGERQLGTIGGGYLEWHALQAARLLLGGDVRAQRLQLVLGREMGQCCGGVVELWLERFEPQDRPTLEALQRQGQWQCELRADGRLLRQVQIAPPAQGPRVQLRRGAESCVLFERCAPADPPLYLYGAGHVGQALVRMLSGLPFAVQWLDSRSEFLPADLPDNVQSLHTQLPVEALRQAPAGAMHLIMTHDHALDYALCRALLQRGDFAFAGLIGSQSKAARFRSRLREEGMSAEQIARLRCPIGVDGIASKLPQAIAVAIAAQLLQLGSETALSRHDKPIETCTPQGCAACPQTQRLP